MCSCIFKFYTYYTKNRNPIDLVIITKTSIVSKRFQVQNKDKALLIQRNYEEKSNYPAVNLVVLKSVER